MNRTHAIKHRVLDVLSSFAHISLSIARRIYRMLRYVFTSLFLLSTKIVKLIKRIFRTFYSLLKPIIRSVARLGYKRIVMPLYRPLYRYAASPLVRLALQSVLLHLLQYFLRPLYIYAVRPPVKLLSPITKRIAKYIDRLALHRFVNRRYIVRTVASFTLIFGMMAGILLPAMKVKADSITWTSNADFMMNKTGKCGRTTLTNLSLSGSSYSDQSCAATGVDSSVVLSKNIYSSGLLTGIKSVATGANHSLGLRIDGKVWGWGLNSNGQLGDNTLIQRELPAQTLDSTGIGALTNVKDIAAGANHSLALKNDGTVWTWGLNTNGQLGDNTTVQKLLPVQVKDSAGTGFISGITAIAASANYSMALKSDGTVFAWGLNTNGQLGDNTTTQRNLPVQVKNTAGTGSLSNVSAIAAGGSHSLALTTSGTVFAWGLNTNGQLGDNTTTQRNLPVQVKDSVGTGTLSSISAIAAGGSHSVALTSSGTVWTWGLNSSGQLGDTTTTQQNLPVQVKDDSGLGFMNSVSAIKAGASHTTILKTDGTVWGWGGNVNGQLGDNTTANRSIPVIVKDSVGGTTFSSISAVASSASSNHVISLKNDGTLCGWGSNVSGQIGDGTAHTNRMVNSQGSDTPNDNDRTLPVNVKESNSSAITNITATVSSQYQPLLFEDKYYAHTLALRSDGTVWAWGFNGTGELGDNTTLARYTPVQVKDSSGKGYLTGITQLAAGEGSSYALRNDGTVWSWGSNGNGRLGDNTTTQRNIPVQVKDASGTGFLSGITSIATGGGSAQFMLAVKNDGTVWGWGSNSNGQLGNNTTTSSNLPVQVMDSSGTGFLTGVSSVSTGGCAFAAFNISWAYSYNHYSLAMKTDGTVWAWGYNGNGQLGDNTTTQRQLPVQVKDASGTGFLSGITSIAAGLLFNLVVRNDGTAWAWGYNANGQLGDNTTTQRQLPVQVKNASGSGFLTNVKSVATGGYQYNVQYVFSRIVGWGAHSMALLNDGTVWTWGLNNYGQLADGTTTQRNLPVQAKDNSGLTNLTNVSSISSGSLSLFGIKNDTSVVAWGANAYGQLGDGTATTRSFPVKVKAAITPSSLINITSVAAGGGASGSAHSLALRNDGTVWAWGNNTNGQLGINSTTASSVPVQVLNSAGTGYLTGITAIAASQSYSLALKNDGSVLAWGLNTNGQLGNNTTTQSLLPVQVKNAAGTGFLANITALAAGSGHVIALRNDGSVWAWGLNTNGQLGDNSTTQRLLPVQVKDSSGIGYVSGAIAIATGANHSLAIKSGGSLYTWGLNTNGQLGDNSTTQRLLPVQVKDSSGTGTINNISSIAAGASHTLATRADGSLYAWGLNTSGQIGDNSTTQRNLPVQVKDVAGTGTLATVSRVAGGGAYSTALLSNGTVYSWGLNSDGQLANNTTTQSLLPVQAKDTAGTGTLSDITAISASPVSGAHTLAIQADGRMWAWGNGSSLQLTESFNYQPTPFRVISASSSASTALYISSGTLSGLIVDMGPGKKAKWQSVDWNSNSLPTGVSIGFSARTSNDGQSWSSWTNAGTQSTENTTSGTGSLSTLPLSRYIELRATLTTIDIATTPTLNDVSLSLLNDQTPPPTNASGIVMKKFATGANINVGDWNNSPSPYFSWTAGVDEADGSGIWGYCLYLGQDSSANLSTTKGYLGASPLNTDGRCQYAVVDTELDLSTANVLSSNLPSSNNPYYLLIKAIDKAGNVYSGAAASFSFRNDTTPPNNVAFVSLPSQFVATKNVTITWPTSGPQAASDTNSGLVGIQYRIGSTGTWYGANHTGSQDGSDILSPSGSYTTDPVIDYPLLGEGNNLIYFRAIDAAGNASTSITSAVIKINSSSPSPPQGLTAIPNSNTTNSFAFRWSSPQTFVGSASALTYCYTINTLPTANTCTFTSPGQTEISAGAYATQPGDNTFYIVAKDEAGNINYATYASTTFTANTSAPGIPLNMELADVSVKATASWKLALSWEEPTDTGAGIASYRIFRSSTSPTSGFTQIASTSGASYVDTKLNAVKYYYKVKACDSANNCGAETQEVSMLPTGRYTTPAELTGNPSVVVGTRKATISWTTARTSDSKVQYGPTSGTYYSTEAATSEQTQSHSIQLNGLEAGTTYYYKARWTDEDGNTGSTSELVFKTLPAPSISDAQVLKVTLNSAIIQFTSKDATKVRVYYGRDGLGGFKEINTSTSSSTYAVELAGLDDGATYSYRIDPDDSDGYSYAGTALQFNTPPRPRISNLRFQPVQGEPTSTQRVTWTTNVPTSSTVTYGLIGKNGNDILDSKLVTDHAITIRNLQDDSNYFLLAQSRDVDGNLAVSDRQTFKTALDTRPPLLSNVSVETTIRGNGAEARGQIVVSWRTDEPATSQVAYGEGSGLTTYNNRSNEDGTLSTEHVVILSDLPTSRVYTVQPVSKDKATNETRGDGRSAIIGRPSDSVITIVLNSLRKVFGF